MYDILYASKDFIIMRKRGRPPIHSRAMTNQERQQRKTQKQQRDWTDAVSALSELGGIIEKIDMLNLSDDVTNRLAEIQNEIRNSTYGFRAIALHKSISAPKETESWTVVP